MKFQAKPWVMPEFLKVSRPMFIGGGDKITASNASDLQRVAQSKSKKAKGIQFMMKALSASGGTAHVQAYQGGSALSS